MSEIDIAFIGLMGTIIVALIGVYNAKKLKIGPNQEKLVETLQDLVKAQGDRITQLEEQATERDDRLILLQAEVDRLTKLTMAQLIRIQELELELSHAKVVT